VFARLNRSIALPAALGTMVALCGCSSFDVGTAWFPKPIDLFGTRMGYSYSDLGDTKRNQPISANDLVDQNGSCPTPVAASSPAPATQDNKAAGGNDAALLNAGIAIGMSECEVVQRLGRPNSVNLGTNPNGLRGVVMTYSSGSRPGVYRFEAGRLTEMDRLEQPAAQAEQKPFAKKKMVKKKPPVPGQPPKGNSSS
jgi:hypothetical protein